VHTTFTKRGKSESVTFRIDQAHAQFWGGGWGGCGCGGWGGGWGW